MAKHTTLSPTLLKVLELARSKSSLTPTEINDHIGKGNYASKHVLYLKILGYEFDTAKDGRNVVSYSLVKEPDNSNELVAAVSSKSTKTPKLAVVKKAAPSEEVKVKNIETMKKVAAKFRNRKPVKTIEIDEEVERDSFSYSVDNDWDSIDGLDIRKLI